MKKAEKPVDLNGLQDIINYCASKIAFIEDFHAGCDKLTEAGSMGVFLILKDIREDLNFVNEELSERRHSRLIIEKEANRRQSNELPGEKIATDKEETA